MTQQDMTPGSATDPSAGPEDLDSLQEQRRAEHLDALGTTADEQPDMTDPEQWREAPKEGGGA